MSLMAEIVGPKEHLWVQHTVQAVEVIPSMLEEGKVYVEPRGDVQGQTIVGCDKCGAPLEGNYNTDCTATAGVD